MNTIRKPTFGVPAPVGRGIRVLLSTALLLSDGGSVRAARDMWSDRRRAAQAARAVPGASTEGSRWRQLAASLPTLEKGRPLPPPPSAHDALPGWLNSAVGLYADVGESRLPARGERRVLIHLLDLHEVEEAQRNTAAVLEQLAESLGGRQGLLVGLEGAAGAFRTADFRALASPPLLRRAADRLLKAGLISGPEFFSLTTEKPLRLWGAEDAQSYETNIRALTDTFPFQSQDDQTVAQALAMVEKLKESIYPAPLKVLDKARTKYEEERIGLAAYVRVLIDGAPAEWVGPNLRLFLEASAQESDLSSSRAAEDQADLLEKLAPQLNEAEARRMMELGLAHRLGRAPYSQFYRFLLDLSARHGVPLQKYPHLAAHAAYAQKTEGINPALFFQEVERLADRRIQALLAAPSLLELAQMNEEIRLIDKLNRFVLTPEDYRKLASRRGAVARWAERGAALARSVGANPGPWTPLDPVVERHEKFYVLAEARNRPFVQNMMPRWTEPSPAVLVAGGYHADGVRAEALAQGLGYISLIPRLSSLENLPPPLESFRQQVSPREWVFRGDQALHDRLETGTSSPSTSFLALILAVIVGETALANMEPTEPEKFLMNPRAVESMERLAVAAKRFGVELSYGVKADGSGAGRLTVFLAVRNLPEVGRIEIAVDVSEDRQPATLIVRISPPSRFSALVNRSGLIEGSRRAIASLRVGWDSVVGVGSRLSLFFVRATRDSAVILAGGIQWVGGVLGMGWVKDGVQRWRVSLNLRRDRDSLQKSLSFPFGVRSFQMAGIAARHPVPMNDVWSTQITNAVSRHIPGNGEAVFTKRRGEPLSAVVDWGGTSVAIRFHVSDAQALSEKRDENSLLQLALADDGAYDVYLQIPAVSNEAVVERLVPRALRDIHARSLLMMDAEEAHRAAIRLTDELENEKYQKIWAMRADMADIDNEIVVAVGSDGMLTAFEDFSSGLVEVLSNPQASLGLTTGDVPWAPPFGSKSQLGLLNLVMTDIPSSLSAGEAKASLEEENSRLDLLAEFIAVRRAGKSSSLWSNTRDRLVELSIHVAFTFLSSVGREEGQRAGDEASDGAVNSNALHASLENSVSSRFYFLCQTLLGLWMAMGVHLEKSDGTSLDRLTSDMLRIYVSGFYQGFLAKKPVSCTPGQIVGANPGTATAFAVGVFDLSGGPQSEQGKALLANLMNRAIPDHFRIMALAKEGQEKEALLSALEARLETEYAGAARLGPALRFLRTADRLAVVQAADVRWDGLISLAGVLDRVQATWKDQVGRVDVFTGHAGGIRLDAAQALVSWAVYENFVLVSQSMAVEMSKKAIRAFINQQA